MRQKMLVIVLGTVLMILLVFQSTNADNLGHTIGGYPACPSLIDFKDMNTFYRQGDMAAVDKMVKQGRCILLKGGLEVYFEIPAWADEYGWAQIHLAGSTEMIWTYGQAIERKTVKVPEEKKSFSMAPTKIEYKLLESLFGIKPGITRRQEIIQKYGKPFTEDWESMRYETGQHSDFKKYWRIIFVFDKSEVLKEIRAIGVNH